MLAFNSSFNAIRIKQQIYERKSGLLNKKVILSDLWDHTSFIKKIASYKF